MSCVTVLFDNMTGVYTEDTFNALNKTQLIDLFLKMQDKTNSTIDSFMAEMKDLRQCWANAQYSQRECVEVIGIPKSVDSKDLEHTVCKVSIVLVLILKRT